MGRRKREPMSEGKKNIIAELIEEYDIRTAKDIEDALRDLMGGTIQEMLEAELDEHLGYSSYERYFLKKYFAPVDLQTFSVIRSRSAAVSL